MAGHGKLLVRHEPLATIVKQALEAYASGRLETQAEVRQSADALEGRSAFVEKRKAAFSGR